MPISKVELQDFQMESMWNVKEGVKDDFTTVNSFST